MRWSAGFLGLMSFCVACSGRSSGSGRNGATDGGGGGAPGTNVFVDAISTGVPSKVDLLLMVDNSIGMADKQDVLAKAVPDLVRRLVSPPCLDVNGHVVAEPSDPNAPCEAGSHRQFSPLADVHVGVITSSLGDHGDHGTCNGSDQTDVVAEEQDDHARLIASRPRFAAEGQSPLFEGQVFQPPEPSGFLNWNPGAAQTTTAPFSVTFQMMVRAAGEFGCGFESQLESIYRFLADPNPPLDITTQPCPGTTAAQKQPCAIPSGRDDVLLAERAAFLRPDSTVVVVMLTDENDCSIRDGQQYFYAVRQDIALPHASSACGVNPNDPCCYSCESSPPNGCQADPTCSTPPDPSLDALNLRCFDQKRRFGIDFLYPTDRYVHALSNPMICTSSASLAYDATDPAGSCPDADENGQPDVVGNPLFENALGLPRSQSQILVAGIVGVPWQDLAATTDEDGAPYPSNELHFKTARALTADGIWSVILGDPTASPPVLPLDGLMVESRSPRAGSDVSGKPIPGPSATLAEDNAMNGHDWANGANDDLMYACIFPLPAERNCTTVEQASPAPGCDCGQANTPGDNNPLCRDPSGSYGTVQYKAKAYPALRELRVLKDLGDSAIVTSICARNTTDATAPDYAYRPAVSAIADRLSDNLQERCLPRAIPADASGHFPCRIYEATPTAGGCDESKGRKTPAADAAQPVRARMQAIGLCGTAGSPPCESFGLCELEEAGPSCHQSAPDPAATPGFCYIDPAAQPGDDPALVAMCPPNSKRKLRFVDPSGQTPAHGASMFLACSDTP